MSITTHSAEVVAVKGGSIELPIPTSWRPVFSSIVNALVERDYGLKSVIAGVEPVSEATAIHLEKSIRDYGATLVALPEETWNSSVCMWYGSHWSALVDLSTREEGRSDLVLGARVTGASPDFSFEIHMVYVP